ncbi:MAG: hypothetical protein QGF59_13380 [Pirellulaceae bacterium]|nr:hypothetical protein [Pirellulaceae bacterium]MDP6719645.1 hypothetical protein [Pirellulaceae bacterium]
MTDKTTNGVNGPRMFSAAMRSAVIVSTAMILWYAVFAGAVPADEVDNSPWKAGVASAVITPEQPMWMAGYASRRKPSDGKIHDLYAKAVVLEDAVGTRQVIVTLDLISVPRPLRNWLEAHVAEQFKLPPESLLINCSHTHCGPEIRTKESSLDGIGGERARQATAYGARLRETLLELVRKAIGDLSPAAVSYCHARAGFAMNRRTFVEGSVRNFPNPEGPVDHDVPVLHAKRSDGRLDVLLFGYACHNTTLGIYQFCGDYAGFAQQYLEEDHPGTVAMFMIGCGGDQNPYPRRTVDLAQRHGRALATAVEAALGTQAQPLEGALRSAYEMVTLDYAPAPTREQIVKLAESQDKYDQAWGQRLLEQFQRDGKLRSQYDCPVQVVRFGESLTLVALPGETVVDYSLRLKRELRGGEENAPAIWVAGYSNDVFAYIPSRRVLEEGGYEAGGAMRYMTTLQPGPFATSVEQRIIKKVHQLYEQLGGGGS